PARRRIRGHRPRPRHHDRLARRGPRRAPRVSAHERGERALNRAATPTRQPGKMTTMIDELRDLFAYKRWASHRIVGAAAKLGDEALDRDLGSSFPSVRATLAHVLSAEWVWLSRWKGTSPTGLPGSWDLSTLDAIRARW